MTNIGHLSVKAKNRGRNRSGTNVNIEVAKKRYVLKCPYTVKKVRDFPVFSRDIAKLSLAKN
jgi:hypothetical protein